MKQAQTKAAATAEKQISEFDRLMQGACTYTPFAEEGEIKISPQIILKYLCRPTKSGVWPDEQQIMKFQMLCRSRKLNPFEGDAYLVGYDGKYGPEFSIITAIQALYKRAESNPQYNGIESGVIVIDDKGQIVQRQGDFCHPGDKLVGGWANVYRKDQAHPVIEKLNLENRDKNRSVWNSDKAGMIVKCAEAGGLRRAFPSQLGGMYVREEAALIAESAGERVIGATDRTAALAARLTAGDPADGEVVDPTTGEVQPTSPADPATQAEAARQVQAVRDATLPEPQEAPADFDDGHDFNTK